MLTVEKKRESLKWLCVAMLVAGFVYSIVLLFSWGNDPFASDGTLSLLCENRKIYFWIWVLLDGGGIFLNINYMYDKFGNAAKPLRALPAIALLFSVGIAVTLGHSTLDWNPKRVAHWAATIGYIIFLGASVLLYALMNIKRDRIFKILTGAFAAILILLIVWFVVLGKSGMFEMIPRALLEILIFAANFFVKKEPVKG